MRVARRGAQAYFSCTSCGNQWLQHIAPETHGHRALIALLVGVLVVALATGGGAAYGALAKGNALALLPWGQPSSGHGTNNSTGSAGESRTATSAPTASVLSLPTPPKPTTTLPQPGARPIIFIPGIMGSYLGDATGETWPQEQALANCGIVSPDYSCQEQVLAPDALSADGTPEDGVTVDSGDGQPDPLGGALSATSSQWCLPPLDWPCHTSTQDWYNLTAENAEASGYTVVQPSDTTGLASCAATLMCFIPVGIDWRLSADTEANVVLGVIDNVLSATHADRVDIVAHSQGGLIVNALVHNPASVGKVYRIVTLGTPDLGAPKLLSNLLYGVPCAIPDPPNALNDLGMANGCFIFPQLIQSLAENYPGVAELAPSQAYYQTISALTTTSGGVSVGLTYAQAESVIADTLASPPAGSGLTPRDDSLMEQAATFHAEVDDWAPLDPTVGLLRMVGFDATDATSSCTAAPCSGRGVGVYDQDGTIVSVSTSGQLSYGSGDGTVPLYSANLYDPAVGLDDRGNAHDMYWCGVSHFGLAWSTPVWQAAVNYLEGSVSYAADLIGPGGGCPDGTDGSLTGSPLIGAQATLPSGSVAPGPATDTTCSASTAPTAPLATSFTIENDSAAPVDLEWYGPSCEEVLYAEIPPQMQLTQKDYVGDVWHLREPADGPLIGTVTATTTPQTVVVS